MSSLRRARWKMAGLVLAGTLLAGSTVEAASDFGTWVPVTGTTFGFYRLPQRGQSRKCAWGRARP
jgi:hypothetical protein